MIPIKLNRFEDALIAIQDEVAAVKDWEKQWGQTVPQKTKWVLSSQAWSIYLDQLVLKEPMLDAVPEMFNPVFELSVFILAWDYGQLWVLLPDEDKIQQKELVIPIARHNCRILKNKVNLVMGKQAFHGAINVMMYILEGEIGEKHVRAFQQWIEQSEFWAAWQKLKLQPHLAADSFLSHLVHTFSRAFQKYVVKEHDLFLLPLLEATFSETLIPAQKKIPINTPYFDLVLTFS